MEATARVVSVDAHRARVACEDRATCGACGSSGRCALRWLAHGRPASLEISVSAGGPAPLQPGDTVVLSIADGELFRAAALVYLLPLAGLLAGALGARGLAGAGEGAALGAGLLGAAVGWLVARGVARRDPPRLAVRLVPGDRP